MPHLKYKIISLGYPNSLIQLDWDATKAYFNNILKRDGLLTSFNALYQNQMHGHHFIDQTQFNTYHNRITQKTASGLTYKFFLNPARKANHLTPQPIQKPGPTVRRKGQDIPCYGCESNIQQQFPKERALEVTINNKPFIVATNPFGFMDNHFVLMYKNHIPFEAKNIRLDDALAWMKNLPDYWIMHNANDVGSTLPEHDHLQAFKEKHLPAESFPIKTKKFVQLSPDQIITQEKFDFPLPQFRFQFQQITPEVLQHLNLFTKRYTHFHPNNRITYFGRYDSSSKQYNLFISLRDSSKKTHLFRKNDPTACGFYEPMGMMFFKQEHDIKIWKNDPNRFEHMMKELAPDHIPIDI